MNKINVQILLAASMTLWLSCPVRADAPGLDFALVFGHQDIPVMENSQALDLRYDTAAIRIAELSSLPVRLDISGGALDARLRPDPRDSGVDFNGQFFALALGADIPLGNTLFAGGSASYAYHSAEGSNTSGKIEIKWRQAEAKLLLGLQFESTRFYGCVRRINIEGETLVQTQINQTLELSERERNGACLGLQMETENGGYIGLDWLNHNNGLYLSLGRRYRN